MSAPGTPSSRRVLIAEPFEDDDDDGLIPDVVGESRDTKEDGEELEETNLFDDADASKQAEYSRDVQERLGCGIFDS